MFISDYIRDGVLKFHQVPTYQQVVDTGTKTLSWVVFNVLLNTVLVVLKVLDVDTRKPPWFP